MSSSALVGLVICLLVLGGNFWMSGWLVRHYPWQAGSRLPSAARDGIEEEVDKATKKPLWHWDLGHQLAVVASIGQPAKASAGIFLISRLNLEIPPGAFVAVAKEKRSESFIVHLVKQRYNAPVY